MFKRYGCGCVYLITQFDPDWDNQPTHGRLVEHCDDDDLRIGDEVEIDTNINPENILNSVTLNPEETSRLFTRINDMIHKGYQFTALTQVLKAAVNGN